MTLAKERDKILANDRSSEEDEEILVKEEENRHTVNVEEEKARDPVGRLGNS